MLTHGQVRLFRKVTSVSIHSFVEWLDTFSYVLQPADVTVKEVNHIKCFAIDIAKDLILLSCRLTIYIYMDILIVRNRTKQIDFSHVSLCSCIKQFKS